MISVIVAAYNIRPYIKKCLNTIQSQTYKDFECIIVDDGSTDGTGKIIDAYVKRDVRFKVIHQQNGGLSNARNNGLKAAKGEYIQFIDGDDYVERELLEKMVSCVQKNNADIVVFSFNYMIRKRFVNTKYYIERFSYEEDKLYSLDSNPELLVNVNPSAWNKLYKKSIFTKSGITYPEGKRFEDLGTTYNLMAIAKRIFFVNQPLYNYRMDISSSLSNRVDSKLYDLIDMTKMAVSFYKEHGFFDNYYEELKGMTFKNYQHWATRLKTSGNDIDRDQFINDYRNALKEIFPDFPKCKYCDIEIDASNI